MHYNGQATRQLLLKSKKKKIENVTVSAKASVAASSTLVEKLEIKPPVIMPEAPLASAMVEEPVQKRTSLRKPESQVRLSFDSYSEAVHSEEATNASKISLFGELAIRDIWTSYATQLDSAILRSNMQMAKINVDMVSRSITVMTHNGVARDMILQEKGILDRLRIELHEPLMRMTVEVDASAADFAKPVVQTRPMNEREKFEAMAKTNPSLQLLKDTLNLRIVD